MSSLRSGRRLGRRQPCACGTERLQPSDLPWPQADLPLQHHNCAGSAEPQRQVKAGQEDEASFLARDDSSLTLERANGKFGNHLFSGLPWPLADLHLVHQKMLTLDQLIQAG